MIDTKCIIDKVVNFVEKYQLFQPYDKLVIACSGGPDSMALIDILQKISEKYQYHLELIVAHAEHGIRGQNSLNDAIYVKEYCQQNNLDFIIEHLEVLAKHHEKKLSIETLARNLRYQFLRKVARQKKSTKIVVAHHLNDQAETVLQHLLRGAGTVGLSGMKAKNGDIIRPFLCLYRREIEEYCLENNLKPCIDETNSSLDYERNRIRLELIPQMQQYNPQVVTAICQSSQIIAEEHAFLTSYVNNLVENKLKEDIKSNKQISLHKKDIISEHLAVRKALYRYIIKRIQGDLENINFTHIDKIDKFLYNGHTGAVLQLPRNLCLKIDYDKLIFMKAGKQQVKTEYNITVDLNDNFNSYQEIILPYGQSLIIQQVDNMTKLSGREHCYIDKDKLKGNLIIRNRKAGDRLVPKGMSGSKKVKDILIDRKISVDERNKIPLICDEQGILWIAGVQQDSHYLVDEHSKHILYLKLKKYN